MGHGSILPTGNTAGDFTPHGPPGIDNRVFVGFASPLAPPGQRFPRLPLIERLTPKSVAAVPTFRNVTARGRVIATQNARKVRNLVTGYVNAARMKRG